ncbi:MAG: hypothetical protein JKX98_03345 [Alcanivoracaceae bacterium]|nr:hypothetical protein [Alcanivoracaceae bacterium]
MKKIIIISFICLSFNIQAQFLKAEPPTDFELKLHNAKDIGVLIGLASEARSKKSHEDLLATMIKIVKLKKNIPVLQYQLAEAYALNDDKTNAFNTLILLQKQGLYFDLESNKNFYNIKSFPVYNYIKENLDANGKHYGSGAESFNINKSFSGLLFENIAFDAKSQSFLMGSLRDGSIIKIANDGNITRLLSAADGGVEGPWAVLDLAVDEKNDVLWVASSAISQFGKFTKETVGFSAIFKYRLSDGKFIKSYKISEKKEPTLISSMHLTEQGDLYLLGVLNKVVLKLAKGEDQVSLVFTATIYKQLRSITADDTGNILYISDSEKGIIGIDLLNEKSFSFASSEALNLTGITDLIYDDNGLIFIQSGFSPERIMRLELNNDKTSIKNVFPIESSHPNFNSPSYGVVVNDGLYYIANSQIAKTNAYGGLLKGQQWEDMVVLSSPKHYKEKSTLDYKEQIKSYKKETGTK